MDYALLTVGSVFTVGIGEERYITSPPIMAAMERTHKMAATTKYCVDTTIIPDPKRVAVAILDSIHATAIALESINIAVAASEPVYVSYDLPKFSPQLIILSHIASQLICQSQVTSQLICQSHITFQLICQSHHVTADLPESRHVTAVLPVTSHLS